MKYIFWQNIISIHQSAFLASLSQDNDVLLVVERELDSTRIKDGWDIPKLRNVNIIIAPNKEKIVDLLSQYKNSIHIFSGLDAYPMVRFAMDYAISQQIEIGVMLEPFNWLGYRGILRQIKYRYLQFKYNKYIKFILAIGNTGRLCYEKVGFSKSKIFDWAYFTETSCVLSQKGDSSDVKFNILFIGTITVRKNILRLVDFSLKSTLKRDFVLNIIGRGSLEDVLLAKIHNSDEIIYHGGVSNRDIESFLYSADLLVLPSIFDGWGAVVNEALMCGTPVIASDHCGASVLLDGNRRGEVFSVKKDNLDEILNKWILKGKLSQEHRILIQKWSENNISGSVAANYFEKIITHIQEGEERPTAPWLKI